jgi:hypothetical protein
VTEYRVKEEEGEIARGRDCEKIKIETEKCSRAARFAAHKVDDF